MVGNDRRAGVSNVTLFAVGQTFERWTIRDDTPQDRTARNETFAVVNKRMVHKVRLDHVLVIAQATL